MFTAAFSAAQVTVHWGWLDEDPDISRTTGHRVWGGVDP